MSAGYIFLILTILSESGSVILMKLSQGFQNRWYVVAAVVAYLASFVFLTLSLRSLPVGLANAVWAGASTLLVALLGIWLFSEKLTGWQVFFFILILAGIIGIQLSGKTN